jgi:methyl-accepting chemotaxis protein
MTTILSGWLSLGQVTRAVGRYREYARFHGLWAPGVRLMRDIPMKSKALLVLLVLLVPLVWLGIQALGQSRSTWRQFEAADAGMRQYALLQPLRTSMRGVMRASFFRMLGGTDEDLKSKLAAHELHLQGLGDGLLAMEADAPVLDNMAHLRSRHDMLLPLLAASRAPTGEQEALLDLRLQDYLDEIDSVRDQIFLHSGMETHDDPALRLLFRGGIELLPRLSRLSMRATGQGARLLANDPSLSRRESLQRLTHAAVEANLLLDMLRPYLQRSMALGLLDKQQLDDHMAVIQVQLKLAQKLVWEARTQPVERDLADALGLDTRQYVQSMASATDAALAIEAQVLGALQVRLEESRSQARWQAACGLGIPSLCLLALLYLLVSIYKVILGGLQAVKGHVEELALGNLRIRPIALGKDESGQTLAALSDCAQRMSRLFDAVTAGVSAVSQASREVAAGNSGLSTRTSTIQQAISDVALKARGFSSLMDGCGNELSRTVDHVRAMQLDAARSRKSMTGLRERMRALTGKSREISHVVQLMEGVAFQTKLLALNASVEAARAGSAGKGFAVVAQEVRSLAVRSEESARRIHDILSSSIAEIEECNLMTERASEAVRHTDEKIDMVHQSMGDIVRQTQLGMDESQEVVSITRQVEESVGGNVQLVEQLSVASSALRSQGDALRHSVQHFLAR